ncbi:MAG: hypothetical protein ACRC92_26490 [Peptostreptococcaceae bacterium]
MKEISLNNIIEEGCKYILLHQVNCKGVMGAGFALYLSNTVGQMKQDYVRYCHIDEYSHRLLGKVLVHKVQDNFKIASCFGQDDYGRDKQYTDYDALRRCLKRLSKFKDHIILIPYKIGCGLAGGDWGRVCSLIEEELGDNTYYILMDKINDVPKVDTCISYEI